MIERGMSPAKIQSYFTRPDRLVNPARIQEVIKAERAADVESATDEQLDYFLDEFARTHTSANLYAPPRQTSEAAVFTLRSGGIVDLVPDDANGVGYSPEFDELYQELRVKALAVSNLGHNALGNLHLDLANFLEALPEGADNASVLRIWMRGNTLRSKHASLEAQSKHPDTFNIVEVEPSARPLFSDLVESFNVFVELVPKLSALEQLKSDRDRHAQHVESLQAIEPAIEDSGTVATDTAHETLTEQVANGLSAPNDEYGKKQVALSFSSVRNFAVAIFTPLYHSARRFLGSERMGELVKLVGNGAALEAGKRLTAYVSENYNAIFHFIQKNFDSLQAFVSKAISDVKLQELVNGVLQILSGLT